MRHVLLALAVVIVVLTSSRVHALGSSAPPAARDSLATADSLEAAILRALTTTSTGPGLLAKTERLLALRSAPGAPANPRALRLARVLHGMGRIEAGELPAGVGELDAVAGELDAATPIDSVTLEMALNSLGRAYMLTGNHGPALRTLRRAVAIATTAFGDSALRTRIALNNLASALANGGDLQGARPEFERLLAIEGALVPMDSIRVGILLNNLANVVSDLGDHARGLDLYQRALAMRIATFGPRDLRVATTLYNLSSLAEVSGQDSLAAATLARAIAIRREVFGDEHPFTLEWRVPHSAVLARLGRADEAFEEAMFCERRARDQLAVAVQTLPATTALRYEQYRLAGLHVALTLAERALQADSARTEAVFDALVRSRAMLLNELAARRRARSGSAADSTLEREWQSARQTYADLALADARASARDAAYPARVAAARDRARRAEAALAAQSVAFRERSRQRDLGAPDVLAALPSNAALVSYVRHAVPEVDSAGSSRLEYSALVTRHGRPTRVLRLGRDGEIDSLVSAWRAAVRTPPAAGRPAESDRPAGNRLRAAVWDPLAESLRGIPRVFVVPDGALQTVNFAALPAGRGYLVERDPLLHVLSAERDLAAGGHASGAGALVVFGGVDYSHGDPAPAAEVAYRGVTPECGRESGSALAPLPGSRREADELARQWPALPGSADVIRREGPAASEEAFKALAPACDVLHVASHGFSVPEDCDFDDEAAGNPLLRSGLVLAGALDPARPEGREDGWLTAEEISALDLSRVRWVVLSACGSGLGEIESGEGVFGLRRAFEIAGAGTLVTSLWDVDDEATRSWMAALYDAHFRRGEPAAESMRDASRAVLARLRRLGRPTNPNRWGAFIATGDWR